jgi:hypothetical protein
MRPPPCPLLEVLAGMPDVRSRRGRRPPLASLLALACCAMRCGARRDSAIAEWGRNDGAHIARALGFRHAPPCAATLHRMFRRLDWTRCEAPPGVWAERVVASLSPGAAGLPGAAPAVALDGKTRRGSRQHGAPGVHLRSAVAHQVGVTLAPQAVAEKTNESTAGETVLSPLVLTGHVGTLDALRTPAAVAETIVEAGGDDVMVVNATQLPRRAESALLCAAPPVGDSQETADTRERGHGRLKPQRVTTSQALAGDRAWPGLAQVLALERSVISPNTGAVRTDMIFG